MAFLKLLSTSLAETVMSYVQVKVAIRRKILEGMDISLEGVSSLLHSNPLCPLAFPDLVVKEARATAANRQVRLSSAWAKPSRRGRGGKSRSSSRGRSEYRPSAYQSPVVPKIQQPPVQFDRTQAQKRPFQSTANVATQQEPTFHAPGSQKAPRRHRRNRQGRGSSSQ